MGDHGAIGFEESFGELLRLFRKRRTMKQLELAVEISVDHSLVSRWETGAQLPARREVHAVCRVLGLDEVDREHLDYAWRRDREALNKRRQSARDDGSLDHLLESLRTSLVSVRALRLGGQPSLARALAARDTAHALDSARSTRWSTAHPEILGVVAELALEECKAGLDFMSGADVRAGGLQGSITVLNELGGAFGGRIDLLHRIALEGVMYLRRDQSAAQEMTALLMSDPQTIPEHWRPEVLRAAAINAGEGLGAGALEEVEKVFHGLAPTLDGGTTAFVLEGLSRGWAGLDGRKALDRAERAREVSLTGSDLESKSYLRQVQLTRTTALLDLRVRGVSDSEVITLLERAIKISELHRYDRYVTELTGIRHVMC